MSKHRTPQPGQLRIVGGQFKGRKLNAPPGQDVRPTTDRMRESLFNILEHLVLDEYDGSPLVGARVLDRFAGTGALGLEALSRGATECWFIERAPQIQRLLAENIKAVTAQKTLPKNIQIGNESLLANGMPKAFGIILCDPPYGFEDWQDMVEGFVSNGLAKPGTLLVTESDMKDDFPSLDSQWNALKDRRFGRVRIQIWQLDHN